MPERACWRLPLLVSGLRRDHAGTWFKEHAGNDLAPPGAEWRLVRRHRHENGRTSFGDLLRDCSMPIIERNASITSAVTTDRAIRHDDFRACGILKRLSARGRLLAILSACEASMAYIVGRRDDFALLSRTMN